jgi:phosphoglycolate phosphatase-like HAD superfamily hydrolase
VTRAVVVDRAVFDVDELVAAAADYLSQRLGGTPPLDPAALPHDAGAAIDAIDAWAGSDAANWRAEFLRWFEAHAPVRLQPDTTLNAALRRARRDDARLALASVLPQPALELVCAHLGIARSFAATYGGDGDLERALVPARADVGADAVRIDDRAALDALLRS